MTPRSCLSKLSKTAFWRRDHWSGGQIVSLGKRTGIPVVLPEHLATKLCDRLNAAITQTRLDIQAEEDAKRPKPVAEQMEIDYDVSEVGEEEVSKQNMAP